MLLSAPTDLTSRILTDEAIALLRGLHARFEPRRRVLLGRRGGPVGFRFDTRAIRDEPAWRVAPIPAPLLDRRVEITGPVDRKMMINAFNSGAQVFMADFEDSHSPTWEATLQGQANVQDAVHGTLEIDVKGKHYAVGPRPALLVVRVRGLHLDEKHHEVEGKRIAAGLFDAVLTLLHTGREQAAAGRGPYLYIPKIESMEEAAWWEEVLAAIEDAIGLPVGTTKVTVLIETLPAAFQMHEILHALRRRIVGLNAGRWDYIFSCIKTYRNDPKHILPDRSQVTMTVPFMRAYTQLLVETCHARGAFAMGGMSAYIPDASDPDKNEKALAAVRADKEREAADGFDGTWVAHPGLVEVARAPFDAVLKGRPNQLDKTVPAHVAEYDLKNTETEGTCTLSGLETNIDVGLRYLTAWLQGRGAVAIHGMMEDAATAEISRSQLWQWARHGVDLEDGPQVTRALVLARIADHAEALAAEMPEAPVSEAADLFAEVAVADHFPPFLTLPAYERLGESA